METDSAYMIETTKWQPRVVYPPNWTPSPSSRVLSDIANSEYSEKALGDPERDRGGELNFQSYKDKSEKGEAPEIEWGVQSLITTVDSSTDTSLEKVEKTSSIVYAQPGNEILYLQVLTNRDTRIVRKPGILPVALYVDAATSTVNEKSAVQSVKGIELLEESMKRLNTKKKLRIRHGEKDVDDFFMEG